MDDKFVQSTCNKSVDNLQQTCRQQAVASHATTHPDIGLLLYNKLSSLLLMLLMLLLIVVAAYQFCFLAVGV